MKKISVLLTLPLLIIASLFVIPFSPVQAAGVGKICLGSSTTCPAPGALLTPPVDVGQNLTVYVNIAGATAFNGFDVQIKTDTSFLNPVAVDTSLTVLPGGASPLLECLNGVLVTGNTCTAQDAIGVLHLAALSSTGANTTASGTLFKAIYRVVAPASTTSLDFNTGCTGTSLTGVCVTLSTGNPTSPISFLASSQGATFQNTQDFTLVVTPTSIETPPSTPDTFTATITRLGGLSGPIIVTASGGGLTISPSTTQTFSGTTQGSITYTISSATSAQYTVSLSATFVGSVLGKSVTIQHFASVGVLVAPTGFSLSASPSSLTIPIGGSAQTTITVTSTSDYSMPVTLSFDSATTTTGVTASFNPMAVTPPEDGSITSTATISVASTVLAGTGDINVTGRDGTTTQAVVIPLTITNADFSVSLSPDHLSINKGLQGDVQVIIQSIGDFSGNINLSATPTQPDNSTDFTLPCWTGNVATSFCISPSGLPFRGGNDTNGILLIPFTFTPSVVFLPAGGTVNASFILFPAGPDATGVFNTTITAASGSVSHSAAVIFAVMDYRFTLLSSSTVTVKQGGSFISQALVESLGGPGGFGFFNFVGLVSPADVPASGFFIPQLNNSRGWGSAVPHPPFGLYCTVNVYDPNGNLIPAATIAQQGPVVFPGRISSHQNGCGSSGGRAFPGPNDVQGPSLYRITAIAFSNTPVGLYTVVFNTAAGNLQHTITYKLQIVKPVVISALSWKANVHTYANNKPQQWIVTIVNPVGNPTLNVAITFSGTDASGTLSFSASSTTVSIPGGQNVTLTVSQDFKSIVGVGVGNVAFTFSAVMHYGLTSKTVTSNDAVSGVPTSGSFRVRT